jgi:hypothetical protein
MMFMVQLSLTVVDYDRNMSIVQATVVSAR